MKSDGDYDYDKRRANVLLDMCEAEKKVAEAERDLTVIDLDEMSAAHAEEVGLNAVYADMIKQLRSDNEVLADIVNKRGLIIDEGQKQIDALTEERNAAERSRQVVESYAKSVIDQNNKLNEQIVELRRAKNARRTRK